MAHTKALDNNAMEQVRAYVGAFLNSHPNPAFAEGPTFIQESFEMFELPAAAMAAAAINPRGVAESLHRTGRWHHQIIQKGVAVGLAHSGAARSFHGGWTLHAVFASPLAAKIAKAIAILDNERPSDDLEAFYVAIPAYKVVCILLRGYSSEEIFVVSSSTPGIQEGKFYPVTVFLNALLQQQAVRRLVPQAGPEKVLAQPRKRRK
jgi:hypothetical protein